MPADGASNNLLDRIFAADTTLVALRCRDGDALAASLRESANEGGAPLYWWREGDGLARLGARHERIPGLVELEDVLRFMEGNPRFGAYFLEYHPSRWHAERLAILDRLARADPRLPRRLVLLGTLADLPVTVAARELCWDRVADARPRLRQGVWVR